MMNLKPTWHRKTKALFVFAEAKATGVTNEVSKHGNVNAIWAAMMISAVPCERGSGYSGKSQRVLHLFPFKFKQHGNHHCTRRYMSKTPAKNILNYTSNTEPLQLFSSKQHYRYILIHYQCRRLITINILFVQDYHVLMNSNHMRSVFPPCLFCWILRTNTTLFCCAVSIMWSHSLIITKPETTAKTDLERSVSSWEIIITYFRFVPSLTFHPMTADMTVMLHHNPNISAEIQLRWLKWKRSMPGFTVVKTCYREQPFIRPDIYSDAKMQISVSYYFQTIDFFN